MAHWPIKQKQLAIQQCSNPRNYPKLEFSSWKHHSQVLHFYFFYKSSSFWNAIPKTCFISKWIATVVWVKQTRLQSSRPQCLWVCVRNISLVGCPLKTDLSLTQRWWNCIEGNRTCPVKLPVTLCSLCLQLTTLSERPLKNPNVLRLPMQFHFP